MSSSKNEKRLLYVEVPFNNYLCLCISPLLLELVDVLYCNEYRGFHGQINEYSEINYCLLGGQEFFLFKS